MSNYKKRGFLLENFRLFHLRSAQGTQVDYHYHEFCKILLLLSGSGGYYIDGQRYLLQTGDIVLLDCRSIHRPELDPGTPYERIIIYISPEYLQRFSTPECSLQSIFSGEKGPVLRLRETQRRKVFQLAASLEEDLAREDFGREILCDAGLLRLLVEIGRTMRQGDVHGTSPVMPKNERIREIIRHIDRHLTEDIDCSALHEMCGVSYTYFKELFIRKYGMPPKKYITALKMRIACE